MSGNNGNIVIENAAGRFEGATEREALAKARRGMFEHNQKMVRQQANAELACLRAQAAGYLLLQFLAEKKPVPRFDLRRPGDEHLPLHLPFKLTFNFDNPRWPIIEWETEQGRATSEHFGQRLVAVAESANGSCRVAFFGDFDNTSEPILAYAIGAAGGEVAFAWLPGLTMQMFEAESK